MAKPETKFKVKVLAELRKIPCSYWQKLNDRTTAGLPDLIGCYRGHFFAIELKSGKPKASPLQRQVLDYIENAGGHAFVMSPENFKEVLGIILFIGSQIKTSECGLDRMNQSQNNKC